MKAAAKPTFADVAQLIAKGPAPDWLVSGLALLSAYVTVSSNERGDYADEIDRLRTAIKTLRRLLPALLNMPIARPDCSDDVVVVLNALPRIEAELARANLRPEKRTLDFNRKCCCAVILEATRLIQLDVQHRPKETYSAYNAYWKACATARIPRSSSFAGRRLGMIDLAQLPIFPCNLAKEPLSVHGF